MKILLLEPPLSYVHPTIFPRHPPHYAAYAAAVLEQAGFTCAIIDAFLERLTEDQLLERVEREQPDLVLIVPFDYTRETPEPITIGVADGLRKRLPGVPVGLAGSIDPAPFHTLLERCSAFDFALVGEYEQTSVAIARAYEQRAPLSSVSGVLWRNAGQVLFTGEAPPVENLDDLPFPAWHLTDFPRYSFIPHRFRHTPLYPLLASRGCPFACITCKEARVAKITNYRLRSVANVMAEIEYARRRWKAREIQFADATFGLDRDWVFALCDALDALPERIPWSAISRIDVVDREMLARMGRAGCWNVLYGVESGNQRSLDLIKKNYSLDVAASIIHATREAGMEATASFILGLPGETRADVLRTIDFAVTLDPDYAQFFLLKHIGQAADLTPWGRLEPEWDISPYDFRGPTFVPFGIRDVAELKEMQRMAYRRFYFRWSFVRRKLPELLRPGQLRRLLSGAGIALKASLKT